MDYRQLGRTGLKVSALCLGTMTWGRQNTEAQGHEQMDYVLDRGINFFDTAEMYAVPPTAQTYGRTEEIIGSWFAARKNRAQVVLATKVAGHGLSWVRGGKARLDRANIMAAIDGSLARLRTDYIDLYQLHWPNRQVYHFDARWSYDPATTIAATEEDNFLEVLQTFGDLVKAGKIRHAGLSNETAWGTMRYLRLAEKHGLPRMVSVQNEYSLLCRLHDWDMAEVSMAEDVGLLAWSPLATGMISGKYLGGALPAGSRWQIAGKNPDDVYRNTAPANEAVREYTAVAKKHGLDVCQLAIAFVCGRPYTTSVIIGATTMEQLAVNIAAADIRLSPQALADIELVRRRYPVPY